MTTPATLLAYTKAEPFRPFRIQMASGKSFEVRHPEMVKLGKTNILIFSFVSDQVEVFDEWQTVSLMLIKSVQHLETSVAS